MGDADTKSYRETLQLLYALLSNQTLSDLAIRIAGLTLINHELAKLDGRPLYTPADLKWATEKARALGLLSQKDTL